MSPIIHIYLGKRFPGTLLPRQPLIEPRRMILPPDFADGWKKIGSKRSQFQDLGQPVLVQNFPVNTILVKEALT